MASNLYVSYITIISLYPSAFVTVQSVCVGGGGGGEEGAVSIKQPKLLGITWEQSMSMYAHFVSCMGHYTPTRMYMPAHTPTEEEVLHHMSIVWSVNSIMLMTENYDYHFPLLMSVLYA